MLNNLFVSEVRVKILKVMLPCPDKTFHVRALVRTVKTEINAVRRELSRLTELGLLRKRPSGNRIYYSVNTSSMYYPELLALVGKEEGLGAQIIKHEKSLGNLKFAVISKAFLRGREANISDVDLFLVGTIDTNVLTGIISEAQSKTGREINYTVMGEEEFNFRKKRSDQFIVRMLSQSRAMLIGDEEEFCFI